MGLSPTNAYSYMRKYVDQKGLATMLVSLHGWIPADHAGDEAHQQGIYPGSKTQGKYHLESKTGVPVAPQKGLTLKNYN